MRLQVGKGMDQYLKQLGNLEFDAPHTVGAAVYEGAKVVADQVKANIDRMATDDSPGVKDRVVAPKSIQKKGLQVGFGIAKMENQGGYLHVKLGFDGYNRLVSKKYPQGQPNAMIARTFEAGNSFTKKMPFVGPAVRQSRDAAERRMAAVVDERIHSIMK